MQVETEAVMVPKEKVPTLVVVAVKEVMLTLVVLLVLATITTMPPMIKLNRCTRIYNDGGCHFRSSIVPCSVRRWFVFLEVHEHNVNPSA